MEPAPKAWRESLKMGERLVNYAIRFSGRDSLIIAAMASKFMASKLMANVAFKARERI
jgi:hypothetical protein